MPNRLITSCFVILAFFASDLYAQTGAHVRGQRMPSTMMAPHRAVQAPPPAHTPAVHDPAPAWTMPQYDDGMDSHIQRLELEIEQLIQEKQARFDELDNCARRVTGFRIAGISLVGLTAVGVTVNIIQAGTLRDERTATDNRRLLVCLAGIRGLPKDCITCRINPITREAEQVPDEECIQQRINQAAEENQNDDANGTDNADGATPVVGGGARTTTDNNQYEQIVQQRMDMARQTIEDFRDETARIIGELNNSQQAAALSQLQNSFNFTSTAFAQMGDLLTLGLNENDAARVRAILDARPDPIEQFNTAFAAANTRIANRICSPGDNRSCPRPTREATLARQRCASDGQSWGPCSPIACDTGYYLNRVGRWTCNPCPAGYVCPPGEDPPVRRQA